MRILVVEDADMVREMLRDALGATGGAVDAAGDVATARQHLRSAAYDWVILDHYLPDGDGLQLLAWIREQGLPSRAIFVTIEGGNPGYRKAAEALDAVAVFGKPFSVYRLIDTIQHQTELAARAIEKAGPNRN